MATMDIDKEFAEVNFRIKMQIRRSALIAEAKLYSMTPEEYAAKLDLEAEQARLAREQERQQAQGDAFRALGQAWGQLAANLAYIGEQFNAGVQEGLKR
ncbi:hypothetical protein SEA_LEAFUS_43 [Microbacterium phage Leafus]|nr:hypothetical protein SEA_LEAFUS_43 [Microbacterium phage Leafus]